MHLGGESDRRLFGNPCLAASCRSDVAWTRCTNHCNSDDDRVLVAWPITNG